MSAHKVYKRFEGIHKILVIKLRHIGDVLLTVPVFRALRETFPAARITALVNSGTEDVLRGNPLIDEVLSLDRGMKRLPALKRFGRERAFLKMIRGQGYDMTIDLTGGDRPAILSFISGARHRLGWKPKKGFFGKRYLYTHLSDPKGTGHMVLQNLDVVRPFGITTDNLSVDFPVSRDDSLWIQGILRDRNIPADVPLVHVHPTSRWLFKCWQDEHMAEVIAWFLKNDMAVIVTSSPERREMEKAGKILSLVDDPRLIDACGRTTISQLAALSKSAALFFGVDSAPMHIAAAVGTPVIALFGPSGAFHWGPWDNIQGTLQGSSYTKRNGIQRFGLHTVVQRDWDCIPCGRDGCNSTKVSRCLDDIGHQEVLSIIRERLIELRG